MARLTVERTTNLGLLVCRPNLVSPRNSVGWPEGLVRTAKEIYGTQNIKLSPLASAIILCIALIAASTILVVNSVSPRSVPIQSTTASELERG